MGELIVLAERRADPSRATASERSAFFFDLDCPFSYFAIERVERTLGDVDWVPTAAVGPHDGQEWNPSRSLRAHAERRAAELRLPLVWPDCFPARAPSAARAAAHAAEIGACARFTLAASRLAFCGGFDLQDPEILAEAAAAAGIPLDACLAAASDPTRDASLHATARGLLAQGVRTLPAVRAGGRWLQGDSAPMQAAALLRAGASYGGPLAPVG